jgi:multisubunit Na+/H+ antiporter MnhE subunit
MPDLIKGTNIDNYLMYATMVGVVIYGLYQVSPTLTIVGVGLLVSAIICYALRGGLSSALRPQVLRRRRRGAIKLIR